MSASTGARVFFFGLQTSVYIAAYLPATLAVFHMQPVSYDWASVDAFILRTDASASFDSN